MRFRTFIASVVAVALAAILAIPLSTSAQALDSTQVRGPSALPLSNCQNINGSWLPSGHVPPGYYKQSGAPFDCKPIPACGGNQFFNSGTESCQCVAGTSWDAAYGTCHTPCAGGTTWNGASCASICGAGTQWNGASCAPICPGGTSWNGSSCASFCPGGTVWNGSSCVAAAPRQLACNHNLYRVSPYVRIACSTFRHASGNLPQPDGTLTIYAQTTYLGTNSQSGEVGNVSRAIRMGGNANTGTGTSNGDQWVSDYLAYTESTFSGIWGYASFRVNDILAVNPYTGTSDQTGSNYGNATVSRPDRCTLKWDNILVDLCE